MADNENNVVAKYVVTSDLEERPIPCNTAITKEDVQQDTKPDKKPGVGKRSSATVSTNTKKSNVYQYKFQAARTDKRVSLNCTPLINNSVPQDYIQRLKYVLGNGEYKLKKGQTIWGFLYSTLNKSCGLIFPYTPQVSFQHTVNYDRTEITHSNLAISHYKNTPPPSISINATFTADTRANALHMLSAIWFLRAVTKCDFGERANVDPNAIAGMPPPVLYLNGYNQVMDNIPVVVTGFNYTLPKDKHYVALGVNLDSNVQAFNDRKLYSDVANGNFYDNYEGSATGSEGMKYLNGIANSIKSLQEDATIMESNRYNDYYFNNWLPTELSFDIQLQIQPNLLKHKKKFNLDWYKMGLFNLDDYKGGTTVCLPANGGLQDVTNTNCDSILAMELTNVTHIMNDFSKEEYGNSMKIIGKEGAKGVYNKFVEDNKNNIVQAIGRTKDENGNTVYRAVTKSVETVKLEAKKSDVLDAITKQAGFSSEQKQYKFDRSGWTW